MLLAIDIGNTNINLGVFNHKRLVKRYVISTKSENYVLRLARIFRVHKVEAALICSVVPKATLRLKKALKRFVPRVYIIGKDIDVPMVNLYRKPAQVGQDRLVNAFAAVSLYKAPAVVIDFGTAVTFDAVSKKKEYLGGLILPGLNTSLAALYEKTALLPRVIIAPPKELIGKDTKESILSGIIYGFSALTDDLARRIKKEIGVNSIVIGTGGDVDLVAAYSSQINKLDRDLTLKGIQLLHEIAVRSGKI